MKSHLWQLAKFCGAEAILAAAFGRQPIVLMYHRFSAASEPRRVSAAEFDRQMQYLAEHCNVVSWSELIAGLRSGEPAKPNTVVVSIDDGYSDVYDIAFPILKKHGVPATVFATSDFVNGLFWHWSDKLHFVVNATQEQQLRLQCDRGSLTLPLGVRDKAASWNQLADLCFDAIPAARAALLEQIASVARVALPETAPEEYRSVSWEQLREMCAGGVSIGGHTVTHPRLPQVSDTELLAEIGGGKRALENELQAPVTSFAYPFGTAADHDARVAGVVQQAGFDSACVAYFDEDLYTDLYALRRFGVGPDAWDFVKIIDGLKRARQIQKRMFRR